MRRDGRVQRICTPLQAAARGGAKTAATMKLGVIVREKDIADLASYGDVAFPVEIYQRVTGDMVMGSSEERVES